MNLRHLAREGSTNTLIGLGYCLQSRVVTDLLTGHNTLRRHLYIMGLIDSPLRTRCRAEDETSAHVLCQREALATL
jgi:hypothetical protein